MERIYLDHCATTPLRDEVIATINECNRKFYGNPSSVHSSGQEARKLLEESRLEISQCINSSPENIVFTSCGSESNNMAIKGIILGSSKKHIITSKVEHLSIINSCIYLESLGYRITYLDVDSNGVVNTEQLNKEISEDTAIVSIQHVNNETGVIQNIKELAQVTKNFGTVFHVDAVQSLGKLPIDIHSLGIDLVSASAHKINGPKGIGFLYINPKIKELIPLIHGGHQEKNRRAGTVNLSAIAGFAIATKCYQRDFSEIANSTRHLRDYFEEEICKLFPRAIIHSKAKSRLYNVSNISFPGHDNDTLLINLDLNGICASAGSACSSGSIKPSHVLTAMGVSHDVIRSSLRFSFGYGNNIEQVNTLLRVLSNALN